MSSEEDEENEVEDHRNGHRFNQPEEFDFKFESGAIPDAAMIHAARKRRQKAREEGKILFPLLWRSNIIKLYFKVNSLPSKKKNKKIKRRASVTFAKKMILRVAAAKNNV